MLYLIAFVTQYLARLIRVQLITLNVTALGVMAFRLWWITRRKTVDAVVPNAD
jgi:hypothetical protein